MGILDRIRENQAMKAQGQAKKLRILQRFTIQQLGETYDSFVDLGDTKGQYVEPGSIADLTLSLVGGSMNRQKLIQKIAESLTLEVIVLQANKYKIDISDIPITKL